MRQVQHDADPRTPQTPHTPPSRGRATAAAASPRGGACASSSERPPAGLPSDHAAQRSASRGRSSRGRSPENWPTNNSHDAHAYGGGDRGDWGHDGSDARWGERRVMGSGGSPGGGGGNGGERAAHAWPTERARPLPPTGFM